MPEDGTWIAGKVTNKAFSSKAESLLLLCKNRLYLRYFHRSIYKIM